MTKENRYDLRYQMITFAKKYGKKVAAREFKTSPNVVRKWVFRYEKAGLQGLKDLSRRPKKSPNKCSHSFEAEVIKVRKQTKNKFGAKRLIERFDLDYGKGCVQRIINEHGLKRKRKTKRVKRNELWAVKKLMTVFEKIQIDVKELTDIPVYLASKHKHRLPKYEFTARCVKTGASFVCYAKANTSMNAAIFAAYLLGHLKDHGFDLSTIELQTDNGAEFNACGKVKKGDTPFEFVVKEAFSVKLSHIPPASPTFNSDVETFHRLVEDEFYAIEPISSRQDLLHKMYTFLIDFNFIRKNSYKDNKTPFQLAAEKQPDFKHDLMNLPPIHLEAHFELYDQFLAKDKAFVTEKIGRADPFDDPAFEICIPNAFRKMAQRGNDVSGLHIHQK